MTREKVSSELLKVKEQIAKLKQKEKQLQDRKREMDDMEILKVTKKIGITPEQLKLLNNLSEKEIKNLLAEREMAKETGNLNTERKGDFYMDEKNEENDNKLKVDWKILLIIVLIITIVVGALFVVFSKNSK